MKTVTEEKVFNAFAVKSEIGKLKRDSAFMVKTDFDKLWKSIESFQLAL